MSDWKLYLILIVVFLITQGLFSMLEMACVSFNKVRLEYWVAQKQRRAIWLSRLLSTPTYLFGATLVGVNASMLIGSECARRFYDTLGLNPDWAAVSQIIIVILFAELAPLSAGRRYAEHVAMAGVPLLYGVSLLLRPMIWLVDLLCRGVNWLIGSPKLDSQYLSRDELLLFFEQREEEHRPQKEMNTIAKNILSLKEKIARELMAPLEEIQMVPAFCTVGEMRALLNYRYSPYVPIYERDPSHIIGIIYPRDLLRVEELEKVKGYARAPWFITENSSILQILKQFRSNNQSLAIVLNEGGLAIGILTLDQIVDAIFGRSDRWESLEGILPRTHHVIVDRTFSGDMKIEEFNRKFQVHLVAQEAETIEELVEQELGHPPERGESVHIDQFELTIEETPLIGPKKIAIRTVY